MLKARIIPTLLMKGLGLVKGVGFDSWRRVGTEMQAVKVYNLREVDELILLDIAATQNRTRQDLELLNKLAGECFVPLTVGGGIRSLQDIRDLLMAGADKVSICTAAIESPDLISQASAMFGSQCIVVSIDARRRDGGDYEAYTHAGTRSSKRAVEQVARQAAASGAGELLVTSIERDGTMEGYDLDLIKTVTEAVDIPVIASGGCGSADHMVEALEIGGASAVAAASVFHFTQLTPAEIKDQLRSRSIPVRS